MPADEKRVEIPFEQYNNLIIIPVKINGLITVKFILDTGVETAILTEKMIADLIGLNYLRELTIAAPGVADSVSVLVTNGITFSLPGGIKGLNMNLMILAEDYLKLSENMGEEIYGIIGYDIFSRFIVQIDYDNKKIVLHNPSKFKAKKRFTSFPIDIRNSKPFLRADICQDSNSSDLEVMVDTGASHAALLDIGDMSSIKLPENRMSTQLGTGIAGIIPGYLSRLDQFSIGKFSFEKVLLSVPLEGSYNKAIKRGSKYGTIGGELLVRFNVTIDYFNKKIYLKKSSRYRKTFEHDMSGLTLNADGKDLDQIKVSIVKENSPAMKVGIKEGDIIESINGKNLRNTNLSEIYSILRKKDGFKVHCVLMREGSKQRKIFRLKRMI